MIQKNRILLLVAWLPLVVALHPDVRAADSPAVAASQQAGSITGRVQNVGTGHYLNKARVSVKGTDQVVFSDEFGTYRLNHVRSGPVALEVFFTDMDTQEVTIEVPAGGTVVRDVTLTSVARYGQNASVVKLDSFVVESSRETNAQAIAINEQRFAPNIKNVMSTDSLGVMMVGGVGEFLKFIPGVTAEYDNADVYGISIRGIGGAMTSFSTDGAEMVNATNGNTRNFQVRTLTLNDISRMEVTKVPTPSNPADSLAGSINFIRKSAFEKSGSEFRYGVIVVGNSEDLTLKKLPNPNPDRRSYRFLPGFDFEYTQPIGKNFGIVVTGTHGNKFNEQHISRNTWSAAGTSTGASFSNPYMANYLLFDGPRNQINTTLSFKADWRVAPHSVLSVGGTYNPSKMLIGNLQFTPNAGANGTPSVANGVPLTFGPGFTSGATGRGSSGTPNINQTNKGELVGLDVKYRYDDGTWRVDGGASGSSSFWKRMNFEYGHFQALNTGLIVPVRVVFSDITATRPGKIEAFDNNNQPVNLYDINNYRITTATYIPLNAVASIRSGHLNARRQLDFVSFPAALQVGGAYRIRRQDSQQRTRTFNYNGVDGNPATTADQQASTFAMQEYVNQDPHYGMPIIPWVSSNRAFAAWKENPILFSQTEAQMVTEEDTRLTNSEYIEEAVTSAYVQAEASLLNSRLKVLTGVRFESTTGRGEGSLFDPNAVFVRNADGTFTRNGQGQRIRRTEAGAANSMAQLLLTRQERAAHSEKTYHGYYPSLHLTYNVKENFLARLAYAKTYGRPDFVDITPRTVINEADLDQQQLADPNAVRGTLTVRNPSLMPWTADNYDLSMEYYTDQGGLFSAGVFAKDIKNFFGDVARLATAEDLEAVGLDAQYVGWDLTTKFNAGDAQILGAEFNARHSLRALGKIGSYFTLFANATRLKLKGEQGASFTSFIPKSGNWGASFNRNKLSLTLRWNYRGRDTRLPQPTFGPDGYEFYKARIITDFNFAYQMSRRFSIVGSVNNLLNVHTTWLRYGSQTPDYARQFQESEYGAAIAIGVKGTY